MDAGITGLFPKGHLPGQGVGIGDPTIQTLPAQKAQFDFGPIQPAPVFGGVMNLQPVDQRPCDNRFERLIQGGRFVGVQVVHHQDHFPGVRIVDLQEGPHLLGEIVHKDVQYCEVATRTLKRQSATTKNEHLRQMLRVCQQNQLRYRYVLERVVN